MPAPPMEWTAEHEARLARLWIDGSSGGEIAAAMTAEFGLRFSSSMVTAKARRMGLPRRAPAVPLDTQPRAIERRRADKVDLRALVASERLTGCRWLEGRDYLMVFRKTGAMPYCGAATHGASAWCPAHYARVYP